ncbi:uncharacterized protein LOC111282254 isoform X2 [Durio zibethinus]|uniref:Uncharacterized protein LOC111282254 isoform X2 n=1 Tax=Durio zibethinus TaxID=66656 RepID=A0A6P5XDS4_DURZI|nr:uncharacterized protein LOC111282254 isoform X2 [Durio zibethinus]
MDSPSSMTCVLKVNTQSRDWHNTLIGVWKGLQDFSCSIDAQQGLAYVSGKVEQHKILRMLGNAGKHQRLSHVHYGNQTRARTLDNCCNTNLSLQRNINYKCYHIGKIDDYEYGYFPYGRNDGCRFDSDYRDGSPLLTIPRLNHR